MERGIVRRVRMPVPEESSTRPAAFRLASRLSTLRYAELRSDPKVKLWRIPTSMRTYGSRRPAPSVDGEYSGLPLTSRCEASTSCHSKATPPNSGDVERNADQN